MYDSSISTPDIEQSRASAQCPGEPHTAIEWHAAVGALALEWALADRVDVAPFLRPAWVEAWTEAFGGRPLALVARRADGSLAGVVPLLWRSSDRAATANWHTPRSGPLAEDNCTGDALACELGWASLEGMLGYEVLGGADDYGLGFPEVASERIFSQAFRRSPAEVLEAVAWRHGRPLATRALRRARPT